MWTSKYFVAGHRDSGENQPELGETGLTNTGKFDRTSKLPNKG